MNHRQLCAYNTPSSWGYRSHCGGHHFVLTAQLVTATVQLYNAIRIELLPTPNKSHYTFNLRDLGKVVQGLMRADPKTLSTQQQVSSASCTVSSGPPCHLCGIPQASLSSTCLLATGVQA